MMRIASMIPECCDGRSNQKCFVDVVFRCGSQLGLFQDVHTPTSAISPRTYRPRTATVVYQAGRGALEAGVADCKDPSEPDAADLMQQRQMQRLHNGLIDALSWTTRTYVFSPEPDVEDPDYSALHGGTTCPKCETGICATSGAEQCTVKWTRWKLKITLSTQHPRFNTIHKREQFFTQLHFLLSQYVYFYEIAQDADLGTPWGIPPIPVPIREIHVRPLARRIAAHGAVSQCPICGTALASSSPDVVAPSQQDIPLLAALSPDNVNASFVRATATVGNAIRAIGSMGNVVGIRVFGLSPPRDVSEQDVRRSEALLQLASETCRILQWLSGVTMTPIRLFGTLSFKAAQPQDDACQPSPWHQHRVPSPTCPNAPPDTPLGTATAAAAAGRGVRRAPKVLFGTSGERRLGDPAAAAAQFGSWMVHRATLGQIKDLSSILSLSSVQVSKNIDYIMEEAVRSLSAVAIQFAEEKFGHTYTDFVVAPRLAALRKVLVGLYHGLRVAQLSFTTFALYCILEAFDLGTNTSYTAGPVLMQGELLVGESKGLWAFNKRWIVLRPSSLAMYESAATFCEEPLLLLHVDSMSRRVTLDPRHMELECVTLDLLP